MGEGSEGERERDSDLCVNIKPWGLIKPQGSHFKGRPTFYPCHKTTQSLSTIIIHKQAPTYSIAPKHFYDSTGLLLNMLITCCSCHPHSIRQRLDSGTN